jgi:ribonuclease Z
VEGKLDPAKLKDDGIPAGPLWSRIQQGKDVVLQDGRSVRGNDYLLSPRKPRKIIVGGDNDTPRLLATEAQTADVLIHEATYSEEALHKIGPDPQHSSAKAVARFANEAKIKNLVLTHFSPRYLSAKEGRQSLSNLEAEARTVYSGNLFLANDFDRYFLDKQGALTKPV